MKPIFPALPVVAICLASAPAQALTIQPALTDLIGERSVSMGNWTLGWSFRLTRSVSVNALGLFAGDPSGVRGSYRLGLWNTSRSLLASATITGLGDGRVERFVWKALDTPLSLYSGDYVVSASGNFLTFRDAYAFDPTSFTLAEGVEFGRNRFRSSASLVFPDSVQPSSSGQRLIGFFGANFSLVSPAGTSPPANGSQSSPNPQPVPGPFPLLGSAAAFLSSRRLRRRSALRARLG